MDPMNTTDASGGGEKVRLADCPVGLFVNSCGGLCLKTEYGNNEGRIDAYIVESGEFFWGDPPQTIATQRAQMVRPVDLERVEAALASAPPAPTPDAGASPLITEAASKWTLSQETLDHLAEIDRATVTAPWSAGYGSCDGTWHGKAPPLTAEQIASLSFPAPTPDAGSDLAKLSDRVAKFLAPLEPLTGYVSVAMPVEEARALAALSAASPPPAEDLAGQVEPVAWRVGNHYGIHVYEGDRLVATFHSADDAARAVSAVNAAPAPSRPAEREEIAEALYLHDRNKRSRFDTVSWQDCLESTRRQYRERGTAVVALLALRDTPRDAGDGWRPISEKPPEADWIVYLPDGADDGMGWALDADERLAALLWWSSTGPGRSDVTHFRRPIAGPPSPNPTDRTQDTDQGGGR